MHLTVPELGALFLALFGVFYWLGIFAATRTVLAFLGAATISGGGFAGRILGDVSTWLSNAGGAITQWLFGAAIAGIPFVIAAIIVIHDLHPKGGKASKRTGWLALLLGASLGVASAAIPALAPVHGAILSLMSGIASFLNSL